MSFLNRFFAAGLLAAACLFPATHATAQLVDADPDWTEESVPPPPAFEVARALPLDMPSYVSLKFGVDPQTISVGKDGVVRYVVVATSDSGVVNALYEGIRCKTGEVRSYARYNASGWELATRSAWRGMRERMPSQHAAAFALQGGCDGRSTPASAAAIVQALRAPPKSQP